ncbi:MAG: FHA domain-containing protein [Anaerolineae bacterium]|nr:FHA domain-containing protein [Anaerolineae bacterium]
MASVILCASLIESSAELRPAGIGANTLTATRREIPPSALAAHDTTLANAVLVATATPTEAATPTATATPTRQSRWMETRSEGIARIWRSWRSDFPSAEFTIPDEAHAYPGGLAVFLPLALVIILLAAGIIILVGAVRILNRLKREWPITKFPPRRAAAPPSPPPRPPEAKEPEAAPPSLVTAARPEPGIPYLESLERPKGVVCCPLTQPVTTIGRGTDNDLMIDEHFIGWSTVSRNHAKVEGDGELLVLVDLDSENGVYVNDQRTRENILHDGCVVSFGQVRFALRMNRGRSTS